MDFSFLWPLLFAGIVFFILKHSADEIAYMSVAVFIVCLLVSLVVAPWQVQFLLLVLVLLGTQRLSQPGDVGVDVGGEQGGFFAGLKNSAKVVDGGRQDAVVSGDEGLHEHLSYRGVDYEVDLPVVEETKQEITGRYRGQVWSSHEVKPSDLPPPVEIKYRGATIKKIEPVEGDEGKV
ncbi:DUF4278 domain-containing protein [Ancylothrix sp. C2]|uniref:DUF4278 domain-containing protein n=1 Tax=Ancylothrix sp. D3o TaxID=2953691 RepID=UPI0021BB3804|nr:DUF4278 domain-containing protein [Ancylothrix sp. D3o]MCT7950586.1 DUF4278 domain-containing protein [Ancylothrix sp. D3o]